MRLLALGEYQVQGRLSRLLTDYSTVVLWVSQNMEDEYSYNLSL